MAYAEDWPQWRGPRRDGVAGGVQLPRNWLDHDLETRWRVTLGPGYSAPLVAADRVFTFGREQNNEVVQAHELATGRVRWRFSYPAQFETKEIARAHGAGPKSTPIVHDGRIYTVGINEVVHCLDTATGRVIWRINFPRRYGTSPPGYGACSSPIILDRLLIVPAANSVVAIDRQSGAVIWRALGDSFYSSLVITELDGRPEIIAFARYRLVGLDPRDGRVLWTQRYSSTYGSNVATPAVWQDRVIISSPSRGTRALRVRRQDGHRTLLPVWETKSLRAYLSSPVLHDDHLYGLDESGQLLCLDVETGRTAWANGNFGEFGSLVIVGNQLLVLNESGGLTAIEATSLEFRQLGQRDVADSATWAHLVIAEGCMFVRDNNGLTCFELPHER